MEWWQFLFTVLFGLQLAAFAGVWVAGWAVSLGPRLHGLAAGRVRTGPRVDQGTGNVPRRRPVASPGTTRVGAMRATAQPESSDALLARSLSVGEAQTPGRDTGLGLPRDRP
jgi:hypothetical protein